MMLVTTNYVQAMHFSPRKLKAIHTKLHGNQPFPCCEAFLFCNTEKTDEKMTYFKRIKQEHFIFPSCNHFCHGLVKNKILILRYT